MVTIGTSMEQVQCATLRAQPKMVIAMSKSERYLACYSGLLTLVFAVVVLTGAAKSRSAKFDQIDVQRINIREKDGTLRMVLTGRDTYPGAIIRDKEYRHPRPQAGVLFYNDEGTESGGLAFAGKKSADGKIDSVLSLTFDRYEQDQQLQLLGVDGNGKHFAGMKVNDVPDRPISKDLEEKPRLQAMTEEAREKIRQERNRRQYYGALRYYAGKTPEGESVLLLADAKGKPRLSLKVTPQGDASIEFLDGEGKVLRTLTPQTSGTKQ